MACEAVSAVPGTYMCTHNKLWCVWHHVKLFINDIPMRTTPLRGKYYVICCAEGTEVQRGFIIWLGGHDLVAPLLKLGPSEFRL